MDKDKLWARFEQTGKVSDYLRYCGADVLPFGVNAVGQESENENEADDRRADHSGKQQYR